MNKYYVYAVQTEDPNTRSCVYVDESVIDKFAQFKFDPSIMEYSGVMVEADTPQEAHEVYNSFSGGEIISADEPKVTVLKRRAHDARKKLAGSQLHDLQEVLGKAEVAAARLAINAYAQGCTLNVLEINKRISRIAELVRRTSKENTEVTIEDIYERLKQRYIEQLQALTYNDPRSGDGGQDEWPGGNPTSPGFLP